jgi:hypothetical protein
MWRDSFAGLTMIDMVEVNGVFVSEKEAEEIAKRSWRKRIDRAALYLWEADPGGIVGLAYFALVLALIGLLSLVRA